MKLTWAVVFFAITAEPIEAATDKASDFIRTRGVGVAIVGVGITLVQICERERERERERGVRDGDEN